MSISLLTWRYMPPPWIEVVHDAHYFKTHVVVKHGDLHEHLEIADWTSDENFRSLCMQAKARLIAVANVTARLTGNSSRGA